MIGAAGGILTGLGFGSAGIVGGTVAAGIQAGIGNVVAGSAFAALQALGAAGIFTTVGIAGGAVALVIGGGYAGYKIFKGFGN